MDNVTNYNNYHKNNAFLFETGTNKEPDKNTDDKIKRLINKCTEVLNEAAERQVPENNKFSKVFTAFDIPNKRYEAFISIMHDEVEPKDKRRVAVEVHHSNSDKFFTEYMFKGTKKEVLNYINDKKNQKEMFDTIKELSKMADNDYK